jgi:hypothetical protein
MPDGIGVGMSVDVSVERIWRKPMKVAEERSQTIETLIGARGSRGQQLDAIAGGNNQALIYEVLIH